MAGSRRRCACVCVSRVCCLRVLHGHAVVMCVYMSHFHTTTHIASVLRVIRTVGVALLCATAATQLCEQCSAMLLSSGSSVRVDALCYYSCVSVCVCVCSCYRTAISIRCGAHNRRTTDTVYSKSTACDKRTAAWKGKQRETERQRGASAAAAVSTAVCDTAAVAVERIHCCHYCTREQ